MIKLEYCKFKEAVRVGTKHETHVTNERHSLVLYPNCTISIEDNKTGETVWTSLFNVPYWKMMKEEKPEVKNARPKAVQSA